MDNITTVKNLLQTKIAGAKVEVSDMTGTNDHLEITIVSDVFEGKTILQQHQTVMDILRDPLATSVHAVKIKTFTTKNYQARKV